ncbi:MAG: AI-2E family transporter [Chloroflexota bacterium]|nr:AI-2E family transporter [Chloroflexota bacterium]
MPASTTTERQTDNRARLTPVSLFLVLLLLWTLTQIQLVLVLGLLALLFGTILERPVQFFEERRFPRAVAILAVYIIILGSLVLLLVAVVPMIADEASQFSDDVPERLSDLQADWAASSNPLLSGPGDQLLQRAINIVEGEGSSGEESSDEAPLPLEQALPVVTSITGGLVSTVTLLVMTFYYLLEKRLLRGLILDTLTDRFRPRVDRLWTEVETKVGGWMRGQLVLCLIIGTIATTSYGIIDLEFWPLLGLWAGLTEIIPIIGPWIGGIPAVLIALTMSWELALITVGIILVMQSLENWVLVPRVMRGAVGLTPLTVFIAILAGTQLMGVIGAVLAIPIAATIQVILTDFLDRRRDPEDSMTARAGWRWMLARSGLRESGPDGPGEEAHRAGFGDHEIDADEPYIAQEESESYTRRTARSHSEDEEPGSSPASSPAQNDRLATAHSAIVVASDATEAPEPFPSADSGSAKADDDAAERDEQPDREDASSFAAWPRPDEVARKKSPSSTWPQPEEGRPDRRRRNRYRPDE